MLNIKKSFILTFLGLCLLCSCKEGSIEEISINLLDCPIDSVRIHKIIQLGNHDSAFVSNIDRIEFYENRIYVLDKHSLGVMLLFSEEGEFFKRLKIGDGPEEFKAINDFSIDRKGNKIIAYDRIKYSKIEFDLDLNFISAIRNPQMHRWFGLLHEDSVIIHFQTIDQETEEMHSYLVSDVNFGNIGNRLNPLERYEYSKLRLDNPISRGVEKMLLCIPFDQHLYSYSNGQLHKEYKLDFGNLMVRNSDHAKDVGNVFKLMIEKERAIFTGGIINIKKYIGGSISYAQKREYFIYNQENKKSYSSINNEALPYGHLMTSYNNEYLVLVVHPMHFKDYQNQHKGLENTSVNEFDNHILILFTI